MLEPREVTLLLVRAIGFVLTEVVVILIEHYCFK